MRRGGILSVSKEERKKKCSEEVGLMVAVTAETYLGTIKFLK